MTDEEREITELSIDWMNAWINSDAATLEGILAEDFTLTSSRSTGELVSRKMWLDMAATEIIGKSFAYDDIKVRVYGDAAVMNSVATQEATAFGQNWSGKFLLTDVWVRRDGRWKVVTRHGSRPMTEK
jgi:uncharacterized protein (TIGR02246 family)